MVAMNLSGCDHPPCVNVDCFAEFIPIDTNIVRTVIHFDSEIQRGQFTAATAANSSGNTMPQPLRLKLRKISKYNAILVIKIIPVLHD